jgi:glycosyltransferase involved in cell wall biosynthesis
MQKNIHVLYLQARTDFTAITTVHLLLLRDLDRATIEAHVACNPGSGNEKPAPLKAIESIPKLHLHLTRFGSTIFDKSGLQRVKQLITTSFSTMKSLSGLVWYTKRHRIQIIHAPMKTRDAFIAVFLAKMTGAKSILHLHQKCPAGDSLEPLARWLVRHTDGVVACSQFVAQSAIAWTGCAPGKVFPVLNSLDASLWDYQTDGSAIRREFGIAPDTILLESIGRLNQQKGGERLLRALALIKNQIPDRKLLIVGENDPFDPAGTYIDFLKALASELGLADQVIFTGRRSDVKQILAACDLFATPSSDEGFGLAFLEAMAMQKPVIGLDDGGTPEVVEHGKSGLLSPLDDIPCLARNILTLITHPELRQKMGLYGRQRTEQYFTPQRMAKEIEQVYKHVLGWQIGLDEGKK